VVAPTDAQDQAPLPPGIEAPEFELQSTPDQKLSLTELRGRPTVLVFYPEDWSPVCSDQLALYQELLPEFERFEAQLVGISVDGIWSPPPRSRMTATSAFRCLPTLGRRAKSRSTAYTETATARASERCTSIDRDGIIRWSYVSPVGINPGA
jgi:peroxiredoxin